jgi:hypothetical protein
LSTGNVLIGLCIGLHNSFNVLIFYTPVVAEFPPCRKKHVAFNNPFLYSEILGIITVHVMLLFDYKFALKIDTIS